MVHTKNGWCVHENLRDADVEADGCFRCRAFIRAHADPLVAEECSGRQRALAVPVGLWVDGCTLCKDSQGAIEGAVAVCDIEGALSSREIDAAENHVLRVGVIDLRAAEVAASAALAAVGAVVPVIA